MHFLSLSEIQFFVLFFSNNFRHFELNKINNFFKLAQEMSHFPPKKQSQAFITKFFKPSPSKKLSVLKEEMEMEESKEKKPEVKSNTQIPIPEEKKINIEQVFAFESINKNEEEQKKIY
jgi:hypothetical protein